MYFLPRYSRIYAYMMHVRPLYRYLGTLGILVLLVSGWYFCIGIPLLSTITVRIHESQHARDYYARGMAASTQCEQQALSVQALKTALRAGTTGFSGGSVPQHVLKQCIQQARASHCEIVSCRIEAARDKQWYSKQDLFCDMRGQLSALTGFLTKKDPSIPVRCSAINITRDERQNYALSCVYTCLLIHA